MSEIYPALVYTPENQLQISNKAEYDGTLRANFAQQAYRLAGTPGYTFIETEAGITLNVDVADVLSVGDEIDLDEPTATRLIRNIADLFEPDDTAADQVFDLDFLWDTALDGATYTHFQRWLNAGELNQESALRAMRAMAMPLGRRAIKMVNSGFRHAQPPNSYREGNNGPYSFGITTPADNFRLVVADPEAAGDTRHGNVTWNWLNMSTLGDCACWGVTGEKREYLYLTEGSSRLYSMTTHNLDTPGQTLGLLLGIASLAYEASRYQGREDIFANVEWDN
jgi:hypothetical protein